MNEIKDFMNRPLKNVVITTPGAALLHEIDVPGRKMSAAIVGVVAGDYVDLHFFGVRKSDGLITTRLDVPVRRQLNRTSLGTSPTLDIKQVQRHERALLRNAAKARLARNFFRRVVKTPELLEGGLEYYRGLTETQWVHELCEEIQRLNGSSAAVGKDFPIWRGTFVFVLDGQKRTCGRQMEYHPETRTVTAKYTFVAGNCPRKHCVFGTVLPQLLQSGDQPVELNLYGVYLDGGWEKTEDFVAHYEDFLRLFYAKYPTVKA